MSTPIDTIWVVDVVFLAEPVTVTPVPTVVLDGVMVSPAVIGPAAAVAGCGATASSPAIASTPASRAVITRRPEVLSSMIPSLLVATLGGGDGRVRERVVGGVRDPGVGAEGGRTGHMGDDGQGDRGRVARRQVEAAVDQVARVAGDDRAAGSRRRLLACHHSPCEPQHTSQHGRNDTSQKYHAHDFPADTPEICDEAASSNDKACVGRHTTPQSGQRSIAGADFR